MAKKIHILFLILYLLTKESGSFVNYLIKPSEGTLSEGNSISDQTDGNTGVLQSKCNASDLITAVCTWRIKVLKQNFQQQIRQYVKRLKVGMSKNISVKLLQFIRIPVVEQIRRCILKSHFLP